jgi:hypothetical protein
MSYHAFAIIERCLQSNLSMKRAMSKRCQNDGPLVKIRRSSQPNFIFDSILTFIALDSSKALKFLTRFRAPFPMIGTPRNR